MEKRLLKSGSVLLPLLETEVAVNFWLSQAWQNPTANGPQGDYHVGHQTHTGEPVWV